MKKLKLRITKKIEFLPPYIFSFGWFEGMEWALFRLELFAQDIKEDDFFTIFNFQFLKFFISIEASNLS